MARTILYIGEIGVILSAVALSGLTYQTDKLSEAMIDISNEKAALVSKLVKTNQETPAQPFSALDHLVMQKHLSLAGYWPEGQRLICADMGGQLVNAMYQFNVGERNKDQLTKVVEELIDDDTDRKQTIRSLRSKDVGLEEASSQLPITSKILKQAVYMITCHEGSFSALLEADIQQVHQEKTRTFTLYLRLEFERNCLIRAEKLCVQVHQPT
jgi:hypothetical protein